MSQTLEDLQSRLDSLTKREKFFLKKMLKAKAWTRYFETGLRYELLFKKAPFIIQDYI